MAINKKGKRKLIFRDQIYYWSVAKDDDTLLDYLVVMSEDCTLYLTYRLDQISDYFVHPKIIIHKSDILKQGVYLFFPPLSDSFISRHNVCAILNWYFQQERDSIPLKQDLNYHPFKDLDFKKGKIEYIESDLSTKNWKEDLLQLHFPNNYILDVGYYGTMKGFIVHVIYNGQWEKPIYKVHQSWSGLREVILNAIDWIDKQPSS